MSPMGPKISYVSAYVLSNPARTGRTTASAFALIKGAFVTSITLPRGAVHLSYYDSSLWASIPFGTSNPFSLGGQTMTFPVGRIILGASGPPITPSAGWAHMSFTLTISLAFSWGRISTGTPVSEIVVRIPFSGINGTDSFVTTNRTSSAEWSNFGSGDSFGI